MRPWIVQVDRRTGLAKARSCDLPCFSVCAQGMGDALAGPAFLLWAEADPSGTRLDVDGKPAKADPGRRG